MVKILLLLTTVLMLMGTKSDLLPDCQVPYGIDATCKITTTIGQPRMTRFECTTRYGKEYTFVTAGEA